jgi:glycosyltransferase involved in cell wall biosynthesis
MRIAYLTAGAAGMYCGSCLHDNALAKAILRRGHQCLLIPTYTPIRTDEIDASEDRVFLGGLNLYLQQKLPFWRFLPKWLTRILDRPSLIRLATRGSRTIDSKFLGALTVSLLRGRDGRQRQEIDKLIQWLQEDVKPDVVVLTNFLIGGVIPEIKRQLGVPVVVTLQGDDIFLDHLLEPYQSQTDDALRKLVPSVDRFLVNSRFYGQKMAARWGIPAAKWHIVPLAIDTQPFQSEGPTGGRRTDKAPTGDRARGVAHDAPGQPIATTRHDPIERPRRVGYLARLASEKGLHHLVDGFIELARRSGFDDVQLHVAGYMAEEKRPWIESQWERLKDAGLEGRLTAHGSPDLAGKVAFLKRLDVFSVPTEYEEPKGLFALEAMAASVPVVLPAHGAFPEMIEHSNGGIVVPPRDPIAWADAVGALLGDAALRTSIGSAGHRYATERRTIDAMADDVLRMLAELVDSEAALPQRGAV